MNHDHEVLDGRLALLLPCQEDQPLLLLRRPFWPGVQDFGSPRPGSSPFRVPALPNETEPGPQTRVLAAVDEHVLASF